ncbi:MAG TPA: hypothetical protein DDX14_05525 [Cyanobacteria bacterium UBA9579]|nr:hypothetical protein [Cyanobacteria bacterium UBA9579]
MLINKTVGINSFQNSKTTRQSQKHNQNFFNKMEKWSEPYYNGDGRLSSKEKLTNVARGAGYFITEAASSPKKLAVTAATTAGIIGTGVGLVTAGIVSAPAILLGAGVISTGLALYKGTKAAQNFTTANGNEQKLADAYFNTGEAITDTIMAGLAGGAAKHAAKVSTIAAISHNSTSEALKVGTILSDNGTFIGSQVSKLSEHQ